MPPNYCPDCGHYFNSTEDFVAVIQTDEGIFSCTCGDCGWSGSIDPDIGED
jgi:hypothetical protein